MANEELINNIKSKHILNFIFNYIKDKNFKDKLFLYSKKLQIKFDIKLIGLKKNYLNNIKLDLDQYLYIEPNSFKPDFLEKEYDKFLIEKKIKKEKIENIIYDIFENKEIKDIDEEDIHKIKKKEKFINIESPLFNILSKTKNFGSIFTIYISQKIIDEYQLKDKYIKLFENLNNLNIKYSSIFYKLKDINKIDYLKEIHINFNKIKKLTIENDYEEKDDNVTKNKFNKFFEILFSFNNIEKNLIYLNIKFKYCEIDTEYFEKINNFKLLRYLNIENIYFVKDFIIKLNTLELLSIISCNNIKLSGISNGKLKEIDLSYNKITDINILEKVNLK